MIHDFLFSIIFHDDIISTSFINYRLDKIINEIKRFLTIAKIKRFYFPCIHVLKLSKSVMLDASVESIFSAWSVTSVPGVISV